MKLKAAREKFSQKYMLADLRLKKLWTIPNCVMLKNHCGYKNERDLGKNLLIVFVDHSSFPERKLKSLVD
jgi:hypothetical protein